MSPRRRGRGGTRPRHNGHDRPQQGRREQHPAERPHPRSQEEDEIVRAGLNGFIKPGHGGTVLADKAGARRDRTIHSYASLIRSVPLPPAIPLRSFHRDSIVIADDIRQCLKSERSGVVLVSAP